MLVTQLVANYGNQLNIMLRSRRYRAAPQRSAGLAARRTRRAVAVASGHDDKCCSAFAAASRRRVAAAASVRNESVITKVAGWCHDARRTSSLHQTDLASSDPNVPESSRRARPPHSTLELRYLNISHTPIRSCLVRRQEPFQTEEPALRHA